MSTVPRFVGVKRKVRSILERHGKNWVQVSEWLSCPADEAFVFVRLTRLTYAERFSLTLAKWMPLPVGVTLTA